MKIGAMNHPSKDPLAEIKWLGENGFDFVDFTFEPPCADPDLINAESIKATLAQYQLDIVAHSAWFIPYTSPFATIRQAALTEFKRALKASQSIGATAMTVHYHNIPPLFPNKKIIEWNIETLTPLCEEAKSLGITIMIENTPNQGRNQLENLVTILEAVPHLKFHIDSGHTKLEKGYDRFKEYLKLLGHKLHHVHLSENDATADQHLPLGAAPRSNTKWPKLIKRLKNSGYDGTISLEVFSEHREYLLLSKKLLQQWWDDA